VFRLMRKYDGASQDKISSPVEGMTQSRVSRIMRNKDHVATVGVMERIADALRIPGSYLGLTPLPWEAEAGTSSDNAGQPQVLTTTPVAEKAMPATPTAVTGEVTDRRVTLEIDIAEDGWSRLTYRHDLHNASDVPFTRLSRELWFEHPKGPLDLKALPTGDDHNVIIQRIHDAPGYTKFACQLFPALQPGESTTVAYTCNGGQFVSDHYWRQSIFRPTDELVMLLRLEGITSLTECSAIEERPDGSEVSATESLAWHKKDGSITVELIRRQLRPNQSVTLRWDVPRVSA
jgi:hypothetical protein